MFESSTGYLNLRFKKVRILFKTDTVLGGPRLVWEFSLKMMPLGLLIPRTRPLRTWEDAGTPLRINHNKNIPNDEKA